MTIKAKLFLSLVLIAGISVLSAVVLWFAARAQQQSLAAENQYLSSTAARTLDYAILAKNLEINVIQVQQFLQDVAATRAMSGHEGGFQGAADEAGQFRRNIEDGKRLAQQLNRPDIVNDLIAIAEMFGPYYGAGLVMADAYIADGPEAGNPLMADFDADAAALSAKLQELTADSQTLLQTMISEATARSAQSLDLSNRIITIILGLALISLLATASVAGFMYANLFAPLSAMTRIMARLASGEIGVAVPETARADEIGLMARAMAVFKENQIAKLSADRLRRILDNLPIGVFVCEDGDTPSFANHLARQMFRLPEPLGAGRTIRDFIPGIERRGGALSVAGAPLDPSQTVSARRTDGSEFPCDVHVDSIVDDGAATVLWVVRDRTENVALEDRLRQAQKLESLGTMAGGIAHELNTPLQFLTDNARFLKSSFADIGQALAAYADAAGPDKSAEIAGRFDLAYLTEEIPQAIDQSLSGLERAAEIVRAVKRFSHPGGQEKEKADLNEIIRTAALVSKNSWKYVAELEFRLADGLPPVECIGSELIQVYVNLINNAAHALEDRGPGAPPGRIVVGSRLVDGRIETTVADNGTGIRPEIVGKVFDPFFTTKAPGRGTGQGLSLVHAIVTKAHHGRVAIDTELGRGTTFVVTLPAAAA